MTEGEWLTTADPVPMLEALRGRATVRKLRLLRAATARLEWGRLPQTPHRAAVEAGEAYADGGLSDDGLAPHRAAMYEQASGPARATRTDDGFRLMCLALAPCQTPRQVQVPFVGAAWGTAVRAMGPRLPPLIRDVFGNPFRPAELDPAWRTPTVVSLAQAIYDEKAFDRMPIWADALEEAGCDDAGVLNHCRAGGIHVRGCWVVDLALGRA